MTTDSNSGFHRQDSLGSMRAISFQSGAVNSSSEMIPMGGYFGGNTALPANSSIINNSSGIIQAGNSAGLETGLAVDWSPDDEYKLKEGLEKFKDEPNIMKYIKIAALLREKSVRDVALRCRWLQRKRMKPEEQSLGMNQINRKDKLVESSPKTSYFSASSQSMGMYPLPVHHQDHNQHSSSQGGKAMHLLEQNAQAFCQITSNLSTYKLQDNIELFFHARKNIAAIINNLRGMPGIMSQMPPLAVSINEDLANSIMPYTAQSMMFGLSGGFHLKQEPRC